MKKFIAILMTLLLVFGQVATVAGASTDFEGVVNGIVEDATAPGDLSGGEGIIDDEDIIDEDFSEEGQACEDCDLVEDCICPEFSIDDTCKDCDYDDCICPKLCEECEYYGDECICTVIGFAPLSGVSSSIPPAFAVSSGAKNTVDWTNVLSTLKPGEIWTDKSVYYPQHTVGVNLVPDGTAVITIYVWGNTFPLGGDDGPPTHPLVPGSNLTITTNIGDFELGEVGYGDWRSNFVEAPISPGFSFPTQPGIIFVGIDADGRMTWNVDESLIMDDEPLRIWYHVYLDEGPNHTDWRTNFWYSTAGDHFEIRFDPRTENPAYWTREEHTLATFDATVNWNNGNGLNSATIRDRILGITISFGKNVDTPQNQTAASVPFTTPANQRYWTSYATVTFPDGTTQSDLRWHLNWNSGAARDYIITVRNLTTATGSDELVDITYVVGLDSGGGNRAVASDRFISSETYFRRSEDDQHNPFEWDSEGRLVLRTPLIAQILLTEQGLTTGTLLLNKVIENPYPGQPWWYYTDTDWEFTARIMVDGEYAAFERSTVVARTYRFTGFLHEPTDATILNFTDGNLNLTLTNMPRYASIASQNALSPLNYFAYEFFTFETLDLISVEYSIDGAAPTPVSAINGIFATSEFQIIPNESPPHTIVTFTNTYSHGIGFLEVNKLLDGFPHNWGVDSEYDFYVRIWDKQTENYLLFFPDVLIDHTDDYPRPQGIPTNPLFTGSHWAVGNHALGLTDFYSSDMIPIMELPLSVFHRLRLSNLWTGIYYEVREVRRADGFDKADTDAVWADFWNNYVGTGVSNSNRVPHYPEETRGTWVANDLGTWIEDNWIGDPILGSDYWIPVRPIISDSDWHARPIHDWHWGVIYPNPHPTTGAHRPVSTLTFNETLSVTITNRYKFHGGDLLFSKELCDNAAGWAVSQSQLFHAQVLSNESPGRLLVFVPHPSEQGRVYRVIGFVDEQGWFNPNQGEDHNFAYQVLCPIGSHIPPDNAQTVITFSAASPARLIEVPVDPFLTPDLGNMPISAASLTTIYYRVEEIFSVTPSNPLLHPNPLFLPNHDPTNPPLGFYDRTYTVVHVENNNTPVVTNQYGYFPMVNEHTMHVTITNIFDPAYGNLAIHKYLADYYEVWNVNNDTAFHAVVYREDDSDSSRIRVWQDTDGVFVYENYELYVNATRTRAGQTLGYIIPFSAGRATLVWGLTLGDDSFYYTYDVIEVSSTGGELPNAQTIGFTSHPEINKDVRNNLIADVTNTFIQAFRITYHRNFDPDETVIDPLMTSNPFLPGVLVTIRQNMFTAPSGFTFNGWNTMADGSGESFSPNHSFNINQNWVLFAQWTPTTPTTPPGGGGGGTVPPPQEEDDDESEPRPGISDFFVDEHIWYIRGYTDGTIRPNNNVTRAEVAMVFFRLLRPEMQRTNATSPFRDVRNDAWYGLAISTLAHHGIFTGDGDGNFRPNAPITRREFAAVVSRFDQKIATDDNPFIDVHAGDWAHDYIMSVTARGWFVGFNGQFRPGNNLTRAELVTAVNRMLNRSILQEDLPANILRFPDLPGSHWSFAAFKEAIHTHYYVRLEDGINERWTEILGNGLDAAYNH